VATGGLGAYGAGAQGGVRSGSQVDALRLREGLGRREKKKWVEPKLYILF
jgi:hypothetical protein